MEKNEKKCQVHLIKTNTLSPILLRDNEILYWIKPFIPKGLIETGWKHNHLYITSDDKIKELDWALETTGEAPAFSDNNPRVKQSHKGYYNNGTWRKIIATTDKSLIEGFRWSKPFSLPQPSDAFINVFIDEYNKCNVIKEVMVEYTKNPQSYKDLDVLVKGDIYPDFLMVNPKNNTITIRKIKDNYKREELNKLLYKVYWEGWSNGKLEFNEALPPYNKWIEKNL